MGGLGLFDLLPSVGPAAIGEASVGVAYIAGRNFT